ncbi:MAG: hypothetical protein KC414_08830 [Romboutsia sp.]|nr:hypothetical protein [Romboutsia sp.]
MSDFTNDLSRGKIGENKLDNFFNSKYYIEAVSIDTEIDCGYDRIFTRKSDGKKLTVEYKTDYMTLQTGNLFLEEDVFTYTSQNHKPGWIYHSQADIIIYFIEPIILVMRREPLLAFFHKYYNDYRTVKTKNDVNEASGLLVPYFDIRDNKDITIKVYTMGK